jgi:hypothetical protein
MVCGVVAGHGMSVSPGFLGYKMMVTHALCILCGMVPVTWTLHVLDGIKEDTQNITIYTHTKYNKGRLPIIWNLYFQMEFING